MRRLLAFRPQPPTAVGLPLAVALSLGALGGCGGEDERLPGTSIDTSAFDPSLDPLVASYPPGPYGGQVGDVIEDFEFEGYLVEDASTPTVPTTFGALSLADLHHGTEPFALLVMAESWCEGSCITTEELALETARGAAAGGVVVEVLLDGDHDVTEEWVRTFELPASTVYPLDPDFEATIGGREWAVVIDLGTQRIVWRDFGSDASQEAPIAVRGVDELVRRCGSAD